MEWPVGGKRQGGHHRVYDDLDHIEGDDDHNKDYNEDDDGDHIHCDAHDEGNEDHY